MGDLPLTIIFLLAAFLLFLRDDSKKVYAPQFKLLIGLTVVAFISAMLNNYWRTGLNDIQYLVTTAIIPFLLISNVVSSSKRQEIVMTICLIASFVMLTNGLSQRASPQGLGWAGSFISQGTRITYLGILRDPNDLGGFFVLCLPFAGYFFFSGKNPFAKLFGLLSSMFLLYGIYLTNSRGALLATLLSVFGFFMYRFGKTKSVFLGIVGSPVVLFAISNFREIDAEESSAAGRVTAWYSGFKMLLSHPLFGVGRGNFPEYDENGKTAHNSFVLVMGELGFVGYSLWFICVTLSLFMLYKGMTAYQQSMEHENFVPGGNPALEKAAALNATAFFSLLGFLGTAFFLSRSYAFILFFAMAIAFSSHQRLVAVLPSAKINNLSTTLRMLFLLAFTSLAGINLIIKVLN